MAVGVPSGVAIDVEGAGAPLVLIHGLATTRVIWRRVLPLLKPGRRVFTLDVPGFGDSPPAGPGFDLDDVADRIHDALAIDHPYDLVGHSMGAAVSLTLAKRNPAAVGRLVLVAPAGLRPMPLPAARALGAAASLAIPARRRAAGLADRAWGRRILMSPGTADPAQIPPAEVRAMLEASQGATRIAAALATAASADLRRAIRDLPTPLGLIWGESDRIIPPAGIETVLENRPQTAVQTIPQAGHIPMMERPEAFAEALHRLLDTC
jgi:pimeloyl-ACP methyl ester carboxylesterase